MDLGTHDSAHSRWEQVSTSLMVTLIGDLEGRCCPCLTGVVRGGEYGEQPPSSSPPCLLRMATAFLASFKGTVPILWGDKKVRKEKM